MKVLHPKNSRGSFLDGAIKLFIFTRTSTLYLRCSRDGNTVEFSDNNGSVTNRSK